MCLPDSFKGPYWEPRDIWLGAYWTRTSVGLHVYICVVPCFPVRLTWASSTRGRGAAGGGMMTTWQEAFEQNKHKVGRAVHEARTAEKIRQGFADHARTIDAEGRGCCMSEKHHPHMLDYDDLAPNIQEYEIATGIVGFRMGYEARAAREDA